MPNQWCIISEKYSPYFNLAAEEYFMKNMEDEVFMIYINNPSIIVGKHQNLLGEINVSWAWKNKIALARRISGGGAVYHDAGNLNFSFILNCANLEKINYSLFTYPIVQALNKLGINTINSHRNDLLLNNLKISGNAMHIYKNRVLCHGTLLFNSELKNLARALKNHSSQYFDKSIKSVPSGVINISESLVNGITMKKFTASIFSETIKQLESPFVYSLNETDIIEIEKLVHEKYSTWDWIYGYSPKYVFKNEITIEGVLTEFELSVEKGIIRSCKFNEVTPKNSTTELVFNTLVKTRHDYNSIYQLFIDKIQNILPVSPYEFCNTLF